jgi:hypothetical protein
MKRGVGVLSLAVLGLVLGATGEANAVLVPNFSFEQPDVGDGDANRSQTFTVGDTTTVPEWTFNRVGGTSAGIFDPQNNAFPNTTGNNAPQPGTAHAGQNAYINLEAATNPFGATSFGSLTSTDGFQTQANALYQLTVAIGDRLDFDPATVIIELLLNNTLVVAANSITGALLPEGTFTDLTTPPFLSTSAGDNLKIRLTHTALAGLSFPAEANFDNVRLTETSASVPEPGTLLLLSSGLMAVGAIAWKRSRRT